MESEEIDLEKDLYVREVLVVVEEAVTLGSEPSTASPTN